MRRLMFQINLLLFSTFPCAVLFFAPFVIALARRLTIKSICGTSFCAGRCLGYHAFDILHMSDRRKDLEVIRKSRFSARNL